MSLRGHKTAAPVLMASLGIACYATMDALMKGLAVELGAYNAMFWRTGIALLLSAAVFYWQRPRWPELSVIRLHLWRGLVTSLMAFLFFWGLIYVPLAEAIALSFIAPLIAMYLARVLLKEPIGAQAVLASLIGFSGALVIVAGKLGGEYGQQVQLGIAAILVSAVLYAYNLILQRQQAIVAKPLEIAFFQNATVFSVYLLFAGFLATAPALTLVPHLFVTAVIGVASLMLISWSYARAEARLLIPVEYTAFIWAGVLGWLFFDEVVTVATLAGTLLIVVGCLMAARQ